MGVLDQILSSIQPQASVADPALSALMQQLGLQMPGVRTPGTFEGPVSTPQVAGFLRDSGVSDLNALPQLAPPDPFDLEISKIQQQRDALTAEMQRQNDPKFLQQQMLNEVGDFNNFANKVYEEKYGGTGKLRAVGRFLLDTLQTGTTGVSLRDSVKEAARKDWETAQRTFLQQTQAQQSARAQQIQTLNQQMSQIRLMQAEQRRADLQAQRDWQNQMATRKQEIAENKPTTLPGIVPRSEVETMFQNGQIKPELRDAFDATTAQRFKLSRNAAGEYVEVIPQADIPNTLIDKIIEQENLIRKENGRPPLLPAEQMELLQKYRTTYNETTGEYKVIAPDGTIVTLDRTSTTKKTPVKIEGLTGPDNVLTAAAKQIEQEEVQPVTAPVAPKAARPITQKVVPTPPIDFTKVVGQPLPESDKTYFTTGDAALQEIAKLEPLLNSAEIKTVMGPLSGRVLDFKAKELGGLGLSKQQIEVFNRLSSLLTNAAFQNGGKQLTNTELGRFAEIFPTLKMTPEEALEFIALVKERTTVNMNARFNTLTPGQKKTAWGSIGPYYVSREASKPNGAAEDIKFKLRKKYGF